MIRRFLGAFFGLLLAGSANAAMLGTNVGASPCAGGTNTCAFVPNVAGVLASPYMAFSRSLYYYNGTAYNTWAGFATAISATFARTTTNGTATDLLPTDASGRSYNSYANNVVRIRTGSQLGYLAESARTNFLLNSAVPATQTTGTLANGVYTLWVNGSGSATMSSGTATGCGTGTATNGTVVNFTLTGSTGTCTVTVTGSLNAFQLELGNVGTSLIVTTASTGARAGDDMHFSVASLLTGNQSFIYSGTMQSALANALIMQQGANRPAVAAALGEIFPSIPTVGNAPVNPTQNGFFTGSASFASTPREISAVKGTLTSAGAVAWAGAAGTLWVGSTNGPTNQLNNYLSNFGAFTSAIADGEVKRLSNTQ